VSGSDTLDNGIVADTGIVIRHNPARVLARFFVAGREDVGPGDSRANMVIERVLALSAAEVDEAVEQVSRVFGPRHDHYDDMVERHAERLASRLNGAPPLSPTRRYLLGACFTAEVAVEAAALCNPSIVAHPDDPTAGTPSGSARFLLSVRGIAEGHRSSIGFREGTVTSDGKVSIDVPAPHLVAAHSGPARHHRPSMHAHLADMGDDLENAAFVLDQLPEVFDNDALDRAIASLRADRATRRSPESTIAALRSFAASAYSTSFDPSTELTSRVLLPHAAQESHGMEDARFVRFDHDDGTSTHYATYTGWDGETTTQHLLQTDDFVHFDMSPMAGGAATGKGLALFPRMVGGRFAALSRSDRESNAVAFSDDLRAWPSSQVVQVPQRAWEVLQLGNCGSPIETDHGWLVLTHGVGPMRTYHLGAMLLDLDDPTRVLARSARPLLSPDADRRNGYVPNVVYSCGALVHGDVMVLPFGIGDQAIGFATASVDALLASLHPEA